MIPVPSKHPPGVVVVVTGELTRYARFMQALSVLRIPAGSGGVWFCGPSVKRNVDEAFARVLQEKTAQWVWLIGDDHSFPRDLVLRLLDRGKECITPLCLNRTPPIKSTLWRDKKNVALDELPTPLTGMYRLGDNETCGDAGMLLRRRGLELTGPPWQDEPKTGTWDVEDQMFCEKLKAKGVDVYVDLENVLGHITPVELVPEKVNGAWQATAKIAGRPI